MTMVEKEKATHSNILAWKIHGQPMGLSTTIVYLPTTCLYVNK